MRNLFVRTFLTLASTGQRVIDADAATPRALRKTAQGYTRVIINQPGHRPSVQVVRNSKLKRMAFNYSAARGVTL